MHTAVAPVVARLVADSKDGYLIPTTVDNQYGERSSAIGKQFGLLKTRLGFGPEHVFHSIRKTVATLLEDAQCPRGDRSSHHWPRQAHNDLWAVFGRLQHRHTSVSGSRRPCGIEAHHQ